MRKTILFVVMTVLSMSIYAQLPRKVTDFTLGTSTPTQVESYFKNKGVDIEKNGAEVIIKNFSHEGITWPYVRFEFYESKLMQVVFEIKKPVSKETELNKMFQQLGKRLSNNYAKHLKKDKSSDDNYFFEDDNTCIATGLRKEKGTDIVFYLAYNDSKLVNTYIKNRLELEYYEDMLW